MANDDRDNCATLLSSFTTWVPPTPPMVTPATAHFGTAHPWRRPQGAEDFPKEGLGTPTVVYTFHGFNPSNQEPRNLKVRYACHCQREIAEPGSSV